MCQFISSMTTITVLENMTYWFSLLQDFVSVSTLVHSAQSKVLLESKLILYNRFELWQIKRLYKKNKYKSSVGAYQWIQLGVFADINLNGALLLMILSVKTVGYT